MNWKGFLRDDRLKFPKDSHGFFSASNYHWLNYSIEKALYMYTDAQIAKRMGSKFHEMAAMLIETKTMLPDVKKTLNMYVNDAIMLDMKPEKQLYYSEQFRGTADAMTVDDDSVLHIFDLKTGKVKASMNQLKIYTAFFCLDIGCSPADFNGIDLRIYQNNEILKDEPRVDEIVPIMDKIITIDDLIRKMEENNYGY